MSDVAGRTARELVAELIGSGMSRRDIAAAIGRHNSLVYQVERGAKPGRNLIPALDALSQGREAPAPARRTRAGGAPAATRRPVRHGGDRWSVGEVKTRRAVNNGARGLGPLIRDAAASGRRLAFTVRTADGREVKIGGRGRGIDAAVFADYLADADGNVWDALEAYVDAEGDAYLESAGAPAGLAVSSWTP